MLKTIKEILKDSCVEYTIKDNISLEKVYIDRDKFLVLLDELEDIVDDDDIKSFFELMYNHLVGKNG